MGTKSGRAIKRNGRPPIGPGDAIVHWFEDGRRAEGTVVLVSWVEGRGWVVAYTVEDRVNDVVVDAEQVVDDSWSHNLI